MASPAPAAASPPPIRGWACVVLESWDPRSPNVSLPQGLTPGLSVQKDDQVWAFKVNSGYAYIHLSRGQLRQRGWVPCTILNKGNQRVDPLPIELMSQTQPPVHDASLTNPSENTLQETLRCLWQTIINEQSLITEAIPGMSDTAKNILFHSSAASYADAVYNCIIPQARTIMANGSFTPEDLRTLPQIRDGYPRHAGIYLIIYGEFGGRNAGPRTFHTAVYVGQTINFQQRQRDHKSPAHRDRHTSHYRLASKAKQMLMVPILLETSNQIPSHFLDIAEFSMVCLFKAWYPGLFAPSNANVMGAYATDFDSCTTFSQIIERVSDRTGWAPTPAYGLNWITPILRLHAAVQPWTSLYDQDKEMFVFRTRRSISVRENEAHVTWNGQEKIRIPIELARYAALRHQQTIHLVVELHKRGSEYLTHPFRYVRLPPSIGQNSELEKLKAVALKIQWLSNGTMEWQEAYIERSKIWPHINRQTPVLQYYQTGLMILCDIEKISYSGGPDWLPRLHPGKVYFLRYDHLGQKYVVEIVQKQVIPWPRDHTMQENTQRLTQMFPQILNADTIIGPRPAADFFIDTRYACDMCYSQRTTTPCKYSPNDHSCQCCRPLNRPCTWSRGSQGLEDFVQGGPLEELGIAVPLTRNVGPQIFVMAIPPFDTNLENEEHGQLEIE
ncbi:hypothetical protein B0T10DRAFT_592254 [Thelonectria olida]|uniref:Uncharacterized protein n=1 Tax=Thelonectria olida TaxID=1576542 RepID=A0A9P9ASW9_9HYPO|nr:hypothetical protein B0T10DRAFT_592254 [Thelonectria olida]